MITQLNQISGNNTELITLYIPHDKQLHEVTTTIRNERGTAQNIKSDATRNHVMESLSKIIHIISLYKKTPENGLIIFCGASYIKGFSDYIIKSHVLEPPKQLKQYLYRCDNHFHTSILERMLKSDKSIGFLALDTKDAGWGILSGDTLDILDSTSSGIPGKHRQGGQSAKRFQKLREMNLSYYYKRVADTTRKHFLDENKVDALILSGPGHTKDEFANGKYLEYRLKNIIRGSIDCSYAGIEGVREAFNSSSNILQDIRAVQEQEFVMELFREINKNSGLVIYGVSDVLTSIDNNVAKRIIVTDNIDMIHVVSDCISCGNIESVIHKRELQGLCEKCNQKVVNSVDDLINFVATKCSEKNIEVEVINGKTEYGNMVYNLGGIASLLRYR